MNSGLGEVATRSGAQILECRDLVRGLDRCGLDRTHDRRCSQATLLRRAGGANIERDGPHMRIDRGPQATDAVGIVGNDPVAHELGRHGDDHPITVDLRQIERLQPSGVGGVADLRPEQAPDLGPLMLDV